MFSSFDHGLTIVCFMSSSKQKQLFIHSFYSFIRYIQFCKGIHCISSLAKETRRWLDSFNLLLWSFYGKKKKKIIALSELVWSIHELLQGRNIIWDSLAPDKEQITYHNIYIKYPNTNKITKRLHKQRESLKYRPKFSF